MIVFDIYSLRKIRNFIDFIINIKTKKSYIELI